MSKKSKAKKLTITVFSDSQGAISITKNECHHGRTKHTNVKYYFLRELIANKIMKLKHLGMDQMIADMLTKGLSKDVHQKHVLGLGIK